MDGWTDMLTWRPNSISHLPPSSSHRSVHWSWSKFWSIRVHVVPLLDYTEACTNRVTSQTHIIIMQINGHNFATIYLDPLCHHRLLFGISHGARDETGLRRHPVPVSCISAGLIIPMPCQRYNIFIFTRVILLSLSPVTPTLHAAYYFYSVYRCCWCCSWGHTYSDQLSAD